MLLFCTVFHWRHWLQWCHELLSCPAGCLVWPSHFMPSLSHLLSTLIFSPSSLIPSSPPHSSPSLCPPPHPPRPPPHPPSPHSTHPLLLSHYLSCLIPSLPAFYLRLSQLDVDQAWSIIRSPPFSLSPFLFVSLSISLIFSAVLLLISIPHQYLINLQLLLAIWVVRLRLNMNLLHLWSPLAFLFLVKRDCSDVVRDDDTCSEQVFGHQGEHSICYCRSDNCNSSWRAQLSIWMMLASLLPLTLSWIADTDLITWYQH